MNTVAQAALPPLQTPSTVEHVYKHLRARIISGYLPAGTRLLELELATQMHVSQGSTREALGRLERDGLVERRERRGTFVTPISHADMREIFALRACVERFAVLRMVGVIHSWQVRELESIITSMRGASEKGNVIACIQHDHSFHQRIVQWANHAVLARIWAPMSAQIQRWMIATEPVNRWATPAVVATHAELLKVLSSNDPTYAAARFEQHVLDAWTSFEARHRGVESKP